MPKKSPNVSQEALNELIFIRLDKIERTIAMTTPGFDGACVCEDEINSTDLSAKNKADLIAFMKLEKEKD